MFFTLFAVVQTPRQERVRLAIPMVIALIIGVGVAYVSREYPRYSYLAISVALVAIIIIWLTMVKLP